MAFARAVTIVVFCPIICTSINFKSYVSGINIRPLWQPYREKVIQRMAGATWFRECKEVFTHKLSPSGQKCGLTVTELVIGAAPSCIGIPMVSRAKKVVKNVASQVQNW
jgi:hypothetical protein